MAPGADSQNKLATRENRLSRLEERVKETLRSTTELTSSQLLGSECNIQIGGISDIIVPLTQRPVPTYWALQSVSTRQTVSLNLSPQDNLNLSAFVAVQNSLVGSHQFQFQWQRTISPTSACVVAGWGKDPLKPDGLNLMFTTAVTKTRQLTFSSMFANIFANSSMKQNVTRDVAIDNLKKEIEDEEEEDEDYSIFDSFQTISCEVKETFSQHTNGTLKFTTGQMETLNASINLHRYGLDFKADATIGGDLALHGTILKKLYDGDVKIGIKPHVSLTGLKMEAFITYRFNTLSSMSWKAIWAPSTFSIVLGLKRTNTSLQFPILLFGGFRGEPVLLRSPLLNLQLATAYSLPIAAAVTCQNLIRILNKNTTCRNFFGRTCRKLFGGRVDPSTANHEVQDPIPTGSTEFCELSAHLTETRAEIAAVSRIAVKVREREQNSGGFRVVRALYGRRDAVEKIWAEWDRLDARIEDIKNSHHTEEDLINAFEEKDAHLGFNGGVKVVGGGKSVVCDVTDVLQQRVTTAEVGPRLVLAAWSKKGLPGFLVLEDFVTSKEAAAKLWSSEMQGMVVNVEDNDILDIVVKIKYEIGNRTVNTICYDDGQAIII